MRDADRLVTLLRAALVRVTGGGTGSGVLVAPGFALTCAHVVGHDRPVTVNWQGRDLPATVRWASPPPRGSQHWPFPDLAVLQLEAPAPEHPCAWLDDRWPSLGDDLVAVAFSDEYGAGASPGTTLLGYGGPLRFGDGEMLRLIDREVDKGMSGGPVLNRTTGGVAGLVKASRMLDSPMGGLATPIRGLRRADPDLYREVLRAHDRHHAAGNAWTELLDRHGVPDTAATDPAEERALLGILATLPEDDDRAARFYAAAGPLAPDLDEILLDHRDVVSELGGPWPEQEWSTLGRRYAVVVRDSARLDDDRVRPAWRRRWEGLAGRDAAESLELVECADRRSHAQLEAWIEPEDQRAALVFGSSPLAADRRAALEVGLPAGVPVMIWRRAPCTGCAASTGAGCAGDAFLADLRRALAGTAAGQLPHQIWRLRNEATSSGDPDHCGQSIVLLWDDPQRRPPRDRLVLPEENRRDA